MNVKETVGMVTTMNKADIETLRKALDERFVELRQQEIANLFKTVSIGTFASFSKAGTETIGEVVSLNRKGVSIEIQEGEKTRRKSLAWKDITNTYPKRPGAHTEPQTQVSKTDTK
jgi:hypothetical protein